MKKGDFKTLSSYVDDKKLIRVGGRVDPSLVSYDNERLVLLPYNSHISKVIIRDAHQVGHNGVAATVAKTRKKYWIIKAHRIAKVIKSHCTVCREIEAKVETQLMANLPKFRLQSHTPPFLYSSLDYFGPLKVKVGRNKTCKHYGVVFTCLNTRAIHCELAVDASSLAKITILYCYFKTILLLSPLFLCYFIQKQSYFNSIIIFHQKKEPYFINVLFILFLFL